MIHVSCAGERGTDLKTEYQSTKRLEIFSKLCKYITCANEQKAACSLETREQNDDESDDSTDIDLLGKA